jgi:hypothetical protein
MSLGQWDLNGCGGIQMRIEMAEKRRLYNFGTEIF